MSRPQIHAKSLKQYKEFQTFQIERLEKIKAGETSVAVRHDRMIVVHIGPAASMDPGHRIDLNSWKAERIEQIGDTGTNPPLERSNGLIWTSNTGYTQLFRNGVIEAVWAYHEEFGGVRLRPATLSATVVRGLERYLKALERQGTALPIFAVCARCDADKNVSPDVKSVQQRFDTFNAQIDSLVEELSALFMPPAPRP